MVKLLSPCSAWSAFVSFFRVVCFCLLVPRGLLLSPCSAWSAFVYLVLCDYLGLRGPITAHYITVQCPCLYRKHTTSDIYLNFSPLLSFTPHLSPMRMRRGPPGDHPAISFQFCLSVPPTPPPPLTVVRSPYSAF